MLRTALLATGRVALLLSTDLQNPAVVDSANEKAAAVQQNAEVAVQMVGELEQRQLAIIEAAFQQPLHHGYPRVLEIEGKETALFGHIQTVFLVVALLVALLVRLLPHSVQMRLRFVVLFLLIQ